MEQPGSLFVVGSLVVACIAQVARMPEAGETVRAGDLMIELGGKGFNGAVAALRLGAGVDGLFALGDDALAGFVRDAFAQAGLDPGLLVTLPGSTGAGVGLIEPGGENRIAVHPGANDRLGAEHAHALAPRIGRARLVTAQFEVPDAVIAAAFAVARGAGVRTLLNPSPFRTIVPGILGATDILVVNATEAAALAQAVDMDWHANPAGQGGAEAALARRLFDLGPGMLVITAGAAGATAYERAGSLHQPGFRVEAVDTIGAGDAFVGGIATVLAGNGDLATALRQGCAAGAMATTRFGLLDALPDLTQLSRFLASAPPTG